MPINFIVCFVLIVVVLIKKQVNQRSNDDTHQSHDKQLAQRREVGLGEVAKSSHCAKCSSGDEEHFSDNSRRINHENHRKSGTIKSRINDEKQGCGGKRKSINKAADNPNQTSLG